MFFADKVATIRDNIINTQFNGVKPAPFEPVNESVTLEMNSFHSVLERDVEIRICKLPLKEMAEVVTLVITSFINSSLLSGKFYKG